MKIAKSSLTRTVAPVLVVGVSLAAFAVPATPAFAQGTPGSVVDRVGGTVRILARADVANRMRVGLSGNGHLIVEDDTHIQAGQGCTIMPGTDNTAADCGPATGSGGVTGINAALGNFGDSFFSTAPVNTNINAGTGGDFIRTGSGNDTINLRDGVIGNDAAACDGGGNDAVVGNLRDVITPDCERRVRF
ncbi:hypothetical protein [Streptomyces sp. HD]|uniref:hypothetical protein n=1 Tax=Streptomyces sp. HD TaxID=3020892 RepID=UPI00232BA47D|nr:hypothetical protein [Streptomyces sp. HD]MDC0767416.1 hypothetical protein [Streptomyces sp. HD]